VIAVVGTVYVVYGLVLDEGAAKIATALTKFETAGDALTIGATLIGVGSLAKKPLTNILSRQLAGDLAVVNADVGDAIVGRAARALAATRD